eukprot:COSAG01_NODE_76712_length_179_cov_6.087500_1_plen_21_part_10
MELVQHVVVAEIRREALVMRN